MLCQYTHKVTPSKDYNGMAVVAQLAVCLLGDVGGRDQDSELPRPNPGDEARLRVNTYRDGCCVTFGFECEVQLEGILRWSECVKTYGIASTVATRSRQIVTAHPWSLHLPEPGGAGFKAKGIRTEILV